MARLTTTSTTLHFVRSVWNPLSNPAETRALVQRLIDQGLVHMPLMRMSPEEFEAQKKRLSSEAAKPASEPSSEDFV